MSFPAPVSELGAAAAAVDVVKLYGSGETAVRALDRQLTPRNEWSDEVALVKAAPGADLAALRTSLEAATDPYYVVNVQDRDQFKAPSRRR